MSSIDWFVMLTTLLLIAIYGVYKTGKTRDIEGYLKGGNANAWWVVALSVMATQASAITFLSTPGQAYDDGMRFLQFYLGLPIAMILICIFFIPMFYRFKVYTAYEYLETRFDLKTRTLTAILFLVQRAFSTGITLYAPSIVLSQLLGWSLNFTILFIGIIVTAYILSGGSRAISVTHKQQMAVIYGGMFIAFGYLLYYLHAEVGWGDAIRTAGVTGKMNIITSGRGEHGTFDWSDKYNIISGVIGGLFLQLSYFGTDQSQVGRYITGASIRESRLGLIWNGLLKVPVQFFILFIGVLVFVFFQFNQPPVYFNTVAYEKALASEDSAQVIALERNMQETFDKKSAMLQLYLKNNAFEKEFDSLNTQYETRRVEMISLIEKSNPGVADDHDYIFMTFVMRFLPIGLIGLLFAVIFSASMSSTASALNALSATFSMDIYKRLIHRNGSSLHYLSTSRIMTAVFGLFAVGFAMICSLFDNLIEAVNILGSLFYGTILGIFLTAFILPSVRGRAVFIAAVISELVILYIDFENRFSWGLPNIHIGYLWYNLLGCILVMLLGYFLQVILGNKKPGLPLDRA